jgi:hypothetical protein
MGREEHGREIHHTEARGIEQDGDSSWDQEYGNDKGKKKR